MSTYQEIGGGYSFAELRVGLIVRNGDGKEIFCQPGAPVSRLQTEAAFNGANAMTIETISAAEFERIAPMVDANQKASRKLPNPRNPKTHPLPFPEIGNAETGKVEQYRLRDEKPDAFGAYLSGDGKSVTVWTGEILGFLFATPNRSRCGRFVTFAFRMNGRDYHARGAGRGMYCGCKAYKGKSA